MPDLPSRTARSSFPRGPRPQHISARSSHPRTGFVNPPARAQIQGHVTHLDSIRNLHTGQKIVTGDRNKHRGRRGAGRDYHHSSSIPAFTSSESSATAQLKNIDDPLTDALLRPRSKSFSSTSKQTSTLEDEFYAASAPGHNDDSKLCEVRFDLALSLYGLGKSASEEDTLYKAQPNMIDRITLLRALRARAESITDAREKAICVHWLHMTFYAAEARLKRLRKFAWLDLFSPLHENLLEAALA